MTIAFLKYNLDSEDDKADFKLSQKASDMSYVISEFYNQSLRRRRKHMELTEDQSKMLEEICDEWNALLTEFNLHDV